MSKTYPVPQDAANRALIDNDRYLQMYQASIETPDVFWTEQAREFLTWQTPFTQVSSADLKKGEVNWFTDGTLNASVNCIDRHLPGRSDQVAIIWEGDDPKDDASITYQELHEQVCRLANVLKDRGVQKGDRVCIYMPMIPEATYAMLACARIGAIHSVVFGVFASGAARPHS